MSRKVTLLLANASVIRPTMVLRSWPSRSATVYDCARAADLLIEDLGVGDAIGVDSVGAHAHRAELLVADGDGRGGAPLLVGLQARGEEIDVRLERRLERLVPVHQVGQDGQRLGAERVEARAEDVGDLAFVDEDGHLRIAHRQLAAVLDLHVLHGIAVGQNAVARLGPMDDVDELLGKETHTRSLKSVYGSAIRGVPFRPKATPVNLPS